MQLPFCKPLLAIILILCTSVGWASQPSILILGDSLSAAFGIKQEEGWSALLQTKLRDQGHPHKVINASISGETTAGGASRAPRLISNHQPQVVIVELGANDGLRGLSLNAMRSNLSRIIETAQHNKAKVLLIGMQLPPNYGKAYTRLFHQTYRDLANHYQLALVPFLFEGLEDGPKHFLPDNLHPTAEAQPLLLDNIWPTLSSLLSSSKSNPDK